MLEERIDVLIQSVDCLTAALERLWNQKDEIKEVPADPPKETKKQKTETKETKTKTEKPKETNHDELHNACLAFIRKDKKANQPKLKKLLKKYKIELIKDLNADQVESFRADLEAA